MGIRSHTTKGKGAERAGKHMRNRQKSMAHGFRQMIQAAGMRDLQQQNRNISAGVAPKSSPDTVRQRKGRGTDAPLLESGKLLSGGFVQVRMPAGFGKEVAKRGIRRAAFLAYHVRRSGSYKQTHSARRSMGFAGLGRRRREVFGKTVRGDRDSRRSGRDRVNEGGISVKTSRGKAGGFNRTIKTEKVGWIMINGTVDGKIPSRNFMRHGRGWQVQNVRHNIDTYVRSSQLAMNHAFGLVRRTLVGSIQAIRVIADAG